MAILLWLRTYQVPPYIHGVLSTYIVECRVSIVGVAILVWVSLGLVGMVLLKMLQIPQGQRCKEYLLYTLHHLSEGAVANTSMATGISHVQDRQNN